MIIHRQHFKWRNSNLDNGIEKVLNEPRKSAAQEIIDLVGEENFRKIIENKE